MAERICNVAAVIASGHLIIVQIIVIMIDAINFNIYTEQDTITCENVELSRTGQCLTHSEFITKVCMPIQLIESGIVAVHISH